MTIVPANGVWSVEVGEGCRLGCLGRGDRVLGTREGVESRVQGPGGGAGEEKTGGAEGAVGPRPQASQWFVPVLGLSRVRG